MRFIRLLFQSIILIHMLIPFSYQNTHALIIISLSLSFVLMVSLQSSHNANSMFFSSLFCSFKPIQVKRWRVPSTYSIPRIIDHSLVERQKEHNLLALTVALLFRFSQLLLYMHTNLPIYSAHTSHTHSMCMVKHKKNWFNFLGRLLLYTFAIFYAVTTMRWFQFKLNRWAFLLQ